MAFLGFFVLIVIFIYLDRLLKYYVKKNSTRNVLVIIIFSFFIIIWLYLALFEWYSVLLEGY